MGTIFKQPLWFAEKFDGRRKEFKGITRNQFAEACDKHFIRAKLSHCTNVSRVQTVKRDLEYFASIPYEYEGDGADDFNKFQKPLNKAVYAAICPGERLNNVYVVNPVSVAILTRKYNDWKNSKQTAQ